MNEPLYKHDCDQCIFLGTYDDVDMYYHANSPETVVVRYGDDTSNYISGWDDEVVIFNPYLVLAKGLALKVKEAVL